MRNHFMPCKAALFLETMRWIFDHGVRLLKETNIALFFTLFESDPVKEYTPPSNFSLEIAKDHLISTTFRDTNTAKRLSDRESCDMQCAVCLKRLRNSDQVWELSNCSHVFHSQCLERWLLYDAKMTCPLCRAPVITLNENKISSSSSTSSSQPSWAVEQIIYFFGDDLLHSPSYSS